MEARYNDRKLKKSFLDNIVTGIGEWKSEMEMNENVRYDSIENEFRKMREACIDARNEGGFKELDAIIQNLDVILSEYTKQDRIIYSGLSFNDNNANVLKDFDRITITDNEVIVYKFSDKKLYKFYFPKKIVKIQDNPRKIYYNNWFEIKPLNCDEEEFYNMRIV